MLNTIFDITKEIFGVYTDTDSINFDTPFDTLEVDSLVLVELAVMLNQRLGIVVTEFEIKAANSVRALEQLCESVSRITVH